MRRVKISIIMLSVIIIFCISSVLITRKHSIQLINMLDKLEIVTETGDKSGSLIIADNITKQWKKYYKQSAVLVKADKLYSAQESIYHIIPLIESDSEEVKNEIESSRQKIKWIYETELPFLRNIF